MKSNTTSRHAAAIDKALADTPAARLFARAGNLSATTPPPPARQLDRQGGNPATPTADDNTDAEITATLSSLRKTSKIVKPMRDKKKTARLQTVMNPELFEAIKLAAKFCGLSMNAYATRALLDATKADAEKMERIAREMER